MKNNPTKAVKKPENIQKEIKALQVTREYINKVIDENMIKDSDSVCGIKKKIKALQALNTEVKKKGHAAKNMWENAKADFDRIAEILGDHEDALE